MDVGQDRVSDAYRQLAIAICEQAVSDLRAGYRARNVALVLDCERFFRSEWFVTLSGLDGEDVIAAVRKSVRH